LYLKKRLFHIEDIFHSELVQLVINLLQLIHAQPIIFQLLQGKLSRLARSHLLRAVLRTDYGRVLLTSVCPAEEAAGEGLRLVRSLLEGGEPAGRGPNLRLQHGGRRQQEHAAAHRSLVLQHSHTLPALK
jgi:hypothetical protein